MTARERPTQIDAVLIVLSVVLTLGMAAGVAVPGLDVRFVAGGLDLVLETVSTAVALLVAALGWVRFQQESRPEALFQAAAFLVLAIANGLNVGLVLSGLDVRAGMSLAEPGQAPVYVFTMARLVVAALLVAGGIAALRAGRPPRPKALMVGSVIAMGVIIAVVEVSAGSLPVLVSEPAAGSLPASTAPGAAAQVVVAALFLWAGALSRRLYLRDGAVYHGWLAVGLVFAAFAQGLEAIYPSAYAGLVTSGDFLRLAFDLTLLVGILAAQGETLVGLRTANADLERLRALDVERATLQERTHLARELHDGLAQNLWLAKLKTGRLAAIPHLGQEADVLVAELDGAIDSGLAEAQQAVTALRTSVETAGPLWDVIGRYVDDFGDRFGLRAEVDCPAGRSGLAPRAEAELIRIFQEALNNVRRHADATVVRVRATLVDGHMELLVGDNGRGFDPDAVGDGAYGLASMRERTALIGGKLSIESRPQGGTRVRVRVPLPEAASTPVGTSW